MPRFVVLRHELPPGTERASHFDLMVEQGAALRTWALDVWPVEGAAVAARLLPDHRRDYLSYEGPVRGDRGAVRRVDEGTCAVIAASEELWTLELRGERTAGRLDLRHVADDRWMAQTSGGA